MRLTPRCPVGNALNDLFCVPKQMGAEIPSAEQIGGYVCANLSTIADLVNVQICRW